jgi:hypothetical protein
MKKLIILSLFLLIIKFGYSQNDTTSRSNEDGSLISEQKYQQLKAKVISNNPLVQKNDLSNDISALQRKYKAQCVAGVIFAGFTCGVGLITQKKCTELVPVSLNQNGTTDWDKMAADTKKKKQLCERLGYTTAGAGLIAIVCFTASGINFKKAKLLTKEISLGINPSGFNLVCNF